MTRTLGVNKKNMWRCGGRLLVVATAISLASLTSEADAFSSGTLLGGRTALPLMPAACGRPLSREFQARGDKNGRRGAHFLRLGVSNDSQQPADQNDGTSGESKKTSVGDVDEFENLDASQKKFKAAAIRKEAVDLGESRACCVYERLECNPWYSDVLVDRRGCWRPAQASC